MEKQKLVYILNRDAQARLTISSPLEAHKSNTLVYHMVGVDVGFENPTFACLEIDYEVRCFSMCILALCVMMTFLTGIHKKSTWFLTFESHTFTFILRKKELWEMSHPWILFCREHHVSFLFSIHIHNTCICCFPHF